MPLVLNFGTAGSHILKTGSFVACRQFVQRDMDVSGIGYPLGVTPSKRSPPRSNFQPFSGTATGLVRLRGLLSDGGG